MARRAARSPFEQLESRLLMSSVHHKIGGKHYEMEILDNLPTISADTQASAQSIAGPSLAAAVPAFSSRPGAADTIYLDFDGHFEAVWGAYSNVTTPEFNLDGVAGFNAAELTAIENIWNIVAEDYAPYNINVTTVQPASFSNGVGLRVSIGAGTWFGAAGGVGYIDSYTNSIVNTVYVFPQYLANWAKYIGDASSHEAGHAFGLQHQSQYSGTKKIADYYAGPGDGRAPIMGNSYDATRGLWWNGTSTSSTTFQDDMAVLAKSANTFGYRADDFGDSSAAAFTLVPSGSSVGTAGVIIKTSDRDYFRFDSAAGNVSFSVSVPQYNNLDAKLELWSSDGLTLLASSDPTNSFGASISYTVGGGSYLVVVASHGTYGDVGTYTLAGTVVPGGAGGVANPTNFSATAIGTDVNLGWTDNATNETGYVVQRSASSSFATFTTFNLAAGAVAMSDTGLAADTTYYYRVQAVADAAASAFASASTVTIPAVVTASASAASSSQVNVSWTNPGAETSFRVERSTNQVDWTTIANPAANVTSFSDTGRAASTTYYYRVFAINAAGTTVASNTASVTTLAAPALPAAPTGLTWTSATRSSVALRWTDNANNESNYIVQRSTNGSSWTTVATLGANATSYNATGLSKQRKYYFRVYARNAVGSSAYSNTLTVTTPRSGTITPAATLDVVQQLGKKVKLLA